MKKQITMKIRLKKETLGSLSGQDLTGAVGGATAFCEPTGWTYCQCGTTTTGGTTSAYSGGSCPSGPNCCY
jgi:hypothetical protein